MGCQAQLQRLEHSETELGSSRLGVGGKGKGKGSWLGFVGSLGLLLIGFGCPCIGGITSMTTIGHRIRSAFQGLGSIRFAGDSTRHKRENLLEALGMVPPRFLLLSLRK